MTVYLLNVTVHLLAALLWLGGMFFLALSWCDRVTPLEAGILSI